MCRPQKEVPDFMCGHISRQDCPREVCSARFFLNSINVERSVFGVKGESSFGDCREMKSDGSLVTEEPCPYSEARNWKESLALVETLLKA